MADNDSSFRWLCDEVVAALDGFASSLDGLDGGREVPNLDWTVAELSAHLASLPRLYRAQDKLGEAFERPADFARFSVDQRSHIDTSDLPTVATLLRSEVGGFVDEVAKLGDPDGHRWLYAQHTTHRNAIAALLFELIVHGQDLGRVTGVGPELTRKQANAVMPATFAVLPAFVDRAKARKATGVYHLRFRGGDDWTYRISDDGEVVVERGRPDRADAHLSADPATFLLVGLGRRNQVTAALKAEMVVWGRRPWKFFAVGDIAVEGI